MPVYTAGTVGHVFVCLHGAGHSAMTFAALAAQMKTKSTIVAIDFRGHGSHYCENETNLSSDVLISDTLSILDHTQKRFPGRSIALIGHGMGGAIATKVANVIETDMAGSEINKAVLGLIVIDVVESSAMEALPFMEQIVKQRPPRFPDLKSVIKYGIQNG